MSVIKLQMIFQATQAKEFIKRLETQYSGTFDKGNLDAMLTIHQILFFQ